MGRIERFEDLVAWQKGRAFAGVIHRLTREASFSRDFKLRDQMWGAAISIPSNIADGFERNRPREFHQHLSVAKASCAEVRSQLYLAFDVGHIDEPTLHKTLRQAEEVARIVGGLRRSVETRASKSYKLSTQHSALSTKTKCS